MQGVQKSLLQQLDTQICDVLVVVAIAIVLVLLYKKMIEALTVLNFNVSSVVNSSSLIPRGTKELKEDDGLMVRYFSSFSLGK